MSIFFGKHWAVHNKIQTPVDVYDAATGVKSGKSIAAFLEATDCSLKGTITLQRKMEKSEASQSRFVTRAPIGRMNRSAPIPEGVVFRKAERDAGSVEVNAGVVALRHPTRLRQ